jgi:hypothetical protein
MMMASRLERRLDGYFMVVRGGDLLLFPLFELPAAL